MSNVEELCDDVVMINNGHLVLNGTVVNEVRNNFGLTRLFIRTDLGLDEVKKLPGVENAIYKIMVFISFG